jgi:hypothetical protein
MGPKRLFTIPLILIFDIFFGVLLGGSNAVSLERSFPSRAGGLALYGYA